MKYQLGGLEEQVIREALEKSGGRQDLAADLLGISRRTLLRRLKEYRTRDRTPPCVRPRCCQYEYQGEAVRRSRSVLTGLSVIGMTLSQWQSEDLYRFGFYLILSALAAGLKVNLPGIRGTMSVCFLFVFIGIADLSASETLVIGCVGTLVQCLWKSKTAAQVVSGGLQHREHWNRGDAGLFVLPFAAAATRFDHIGPLTADRHRLGLLRS